MIKKLIMAFFLSCCILNYKQTIAQPALPPCSEAGPDEPCYPDEDVPLDGGIGILLAAGTLYGLKKLNEKKQEAD